MKVSVVSTVYNGEPYFHLALKSIQEQEHDDFEYLLVNDGSSDHTGELLDEAAKQDSCLRVIHPGRIGRCKVLNFAVEQAQGEHIV